LCQLEFELALALGSLGRRLPGALQLTVFLRERPDLGLDFCQAGLQFPRPRLQLLLPAAWAFRSAFDFAPRRFQLARQFFPARLALRQGRFKLEQLLRIVGRLQFVLKVVLDPSNVKATVQERP